MNKQKILIGTFVLIVILGSVFGGAAIDRASASHEVEAGNLTMLDAGEISAFRWIAMAEFYAANSEVLETANVDLTTLNAGDISTYRWIAMAEFYATQNELVGTDTHFSPPGR